MTDFEGLYLAPPILRAVAEEGYTVPTPIQARAIAPLMDGKDLMGIAQTGTGKTAAFALPLLHRLAEITQKTKKRSTRALILAPTRELANQIHSCIKTYSKYLHLKTAVAYGGVSISGQISKLHHGVDILVATPGRLLDLERQGCLRLEWVEVFILDEADRMLDMGFQRDVNKIISALPKIRQSLLFSATMPSEISRLSKEILVDPVRVEVTPQATPIERIEQSIYHVAAKDKVSLLTKILEAPVMSKVIVFTRTKHRANQVVEKLGGFGISSEAIHGNKTQAARQRALKRFRDGDARVLVATDIAARGIDVEGITHVINFELPNVPESYVHRIGRTARAGASGAAVSFCDPAERAYLKDIERLIQKSLNVIGEKPMAFNAQIANKGTDKGKARNKRSRRRSGRNHNLSSNHAAKPTKAKSSQDGLYA